MSISGNKVVMLLCDLQTAFQSKISCLAEVTKAAQRMTKAASILNIPLVVTEQYPKGLGHTLKEIDISNGKVFEKTSFSGVTEEMKEHLSTLYDGKTSDVILFGLEAHICVQQTCMDLIKEGFKVHIIADATSSRAHHDRMFAFEALRQAGGFITTSESILFSLLGNSKHPNFREIQKLIIEPLPDQGMFPKQ